MECPRCRSWFKMELKEQSTEEYRCKECNLREIGYCGICHERHKPHSAYDFNLDGYHIVVYPFHKRLFIWRAGSVSVDVQLTGTILPIDFNDLDYLEKLILLV